MNLWAFACTAETLCSHALLILTKSFEFKNHVVFEQKFKDLLSSKCPVSVTMRLLDLESDVR